MSRASKSERSDTMNISPDASYLDSPPKRTLFDFPRADVKDDMCSSDLCEFVIVEVCVLET
jgi:hypothetical protein